MEYMFSQKKSNCSCAYSCSHVGCKKALVFLSFAVFILVIWNIFLQYQVYTVSVKLNGCTQNGEKKAQMVNEMKNSSTENNRAKSMPLPFLVRERRSNRRLRNRVSTLEDGYAALNCTVEILKAVILKKVAHLAMSNSMNRTILYTRVDNIANCSSNAGCLRWDNPLEEFKDSFTFIKDGNNMPVAIKITSPGIYYVYAQLAISGPDLSTSYDSTVGFQIVQVRGQREFTLSKGIATQDQRGRRYQNINSKPFPVDTVLAQGTFKFYCYDMIYVRLMGNTEISFGSDTSYFGIYQVNPANNPEYEDHSNHP
ncbi:uncharacterized protein LOC133202679 [Saccostrea echinata]|uniref:uncharacterized protein LOC133202679 n=1 Tax=Saccostrea echinata TaxID=191078 RepID=UPI002A837BBA|nr:uncharacterized protein LOC133202679 [Saccostrea echinata]